MSDSLQPHEPQHARPPCPSSTHEVYPSSCPLSWWCHSIISSSVILFSSCLQYFPTSGSFQMSQLFASGGQNIGVSASTSVLPINTWEWSPLGWTGWISLQSKGLKHLLQHHSSKASIFLHSAFSNQSILDYSPVYQSVHSYEGTTRGWEKRHLKGLKEMVFRVQPSLGTVNVFQIRDLINQGDTGKST